jgi:hypothetical protein
MPQANFKPAQIGDLAVVEVEEGAWVLGEVVSVTKQHRRVRRILHGAAGERAVGPRCTIRIADKHRMNQRRAFQLWLKAPAAFPTWEAAREWLKPALLHPGEATDDWESAPLSKTAGHIQAQEE